MTPSRAPRRRLAAAVTAVLAITAGTAVTAAPTATATTAGTAAAASATSAEDTPAGYKVPEDVSIVSSGPSGFAGIVSRYINDYDEWPMVETRWYRPDGTATFLSRVDRSDYTVPNALFSDIMPMLDRYGRKLTLHDMSAPAGTAPVVIDLDRLGSDYRYMAMVGSTVLADVGPYGGPRKLHLLSKSGDTVVDREITGLPATFGRPFAVTGIPGTIIVRYESADGVETGMLAIDLAAGAVTHAYPTLPYGQDGYRRMAVSPTKLAVWQGENLLVTDRATGTDTSIAVGRDEGSAILDLLGNWVAYGKATKPDGGTPGDPLVPFTARSLTDGRTVTLLDHASRSLSGPDGTLLVQGVSATKGEGIFRIALGADGTPTTELVASTGKSTPLSLLSTDIAPVNDLDPGKPLQLNWTLSHRRFSYTLRLVHKQSGRAFVHTGRGRYDGEIPFSWDAASAPTGSTLGQDPFNGDYTWDLTATPDNGTGPDVHATGEFKV
ncbi:hypothetical protein ABZY68_30660, partial [Streptomyces sp. NPDC006482]|uniref:hypothetical protein n=1 Tax=Streptomyces sp. NPDC006482 TaxID=3154306 RepID=UPI0033A655F4